MRGLLFSGVIVGAAWVGLTPAMATPLAKPGLSGPSINATQVEKVGYWRRQYRRYGYPAPYAYYPPAYGYYPPPVVYAYPPAVYGYRPAPPLATPILHQCMAMRHLRRQSIGRRGLRRLSACRRRLPSNAGRVRRISGEWLLGSQSKTHGT